MSIDQSIRGLFAKWFVIGSIGITACAMIIILPSEYTSVIMMAGIGAIVGTVIAMLIASVDVWLFVPASWGAAIAALIRTSEYQSGDRGLTFASTIAAILCVVAVTALAADKAGFDFRGKRKM